MVLWKDGYTDWVQLKVINYSNSVEVAKYVFANSIQENPEFDWWVSRVLSCWNITISKMKSKYCRTTHKFGIRLHKTVEESLRIDK